MGISCVDQFHEFIDYNAVDQNDLFDAISSFNFSPMNSNNVNEQWACLFSCFNLLLSMFPVKRRQLFRNKDNDWYLSSDISYYASIRDIAFKQYMITRSQDDWKNYCKANNKAKAVVQRLKVLLTRHCWKIFIF